MPTTEELIDIYRDYDDEKLIELYGIIDGYTEEAKLAFAQVLTEAGGLDQVKLRLKQKADLEVEKNKISQEAIDLLKEGKDLSEIKETLHSELLSTEELSQVIDTSLANHQVKVEDERIKPRTFIGGIIGGFIGGTIGGALWGYQMIGSNKMFLIFFIGLILNCYFFVWLFTRQSRRNLVVVIITTIAVVYALVLGQVIYEVFSPVDY